MNFLKFFLRHYTSPFKIVYKQRNCVHAACFHGRLEMLKLFFDSDFYFKRGFICRRKILMTSKQKIEVVNNVTGKRINSPLHLAVERNNDKIINYLLKQGAKIDLYNARGLNPF